MRADMTSITWDYKNQTQSHTRNRLPKHFYQFLKFNLMQNTKDQFWQSFEISETLNLLDPTQVHKFYNILNSIINRDPVQGIFTLVKFLLEFRNLVG